MQKLGSIKKVSAETTKSFCNLETFEKGSVRKTHYGNEREPVSKRVQYPHSKRPDIGDSDSSSAFCTAFHTAED